MTPVARDSLRSTTATICGSRSKRFEHRLWIEPQFKHYTVAEAKLPGDALMTIPDVPLETVAICADLDKNVFYAEHTDPSVAQALKQSHWYEVREWTTTGPGTDVAA